MSRDVLKSDERVFPINKSLGGVTEFVVSKADNNRMGGVFPKSRVEGKLQMRDRQGRLKIELVIKEADIGNDYCFGEETLGMSPAQRYYERWKFLRKNKISTARSMRVVDRTRVAMGNMTADGSGFFGKGKEFLLKNEEAHRELTVIEEVYLSLDEEKVKKEIARYQRQTWDIGIRLPMDDQYDLLVHTDGSFELVLMDLTHLFRRHDEPETELVAELMKMLERQSDIREQLIRIRIPRKEQLVEEYR